MKIKWTDGRKIEWLYSASGTKLRNTVYDNTWLVEEQTDYIGGFVYEKNFGSLDTELKYFGFSEGRILNEFEWQYEYFMKDHLGNVRKTLRLIGRMPETWQEDFYYPFGLRERRYVNGAENKELYNNKELTDAHDLFWYHYGMRYYNPQLGRWHTMDPADEFNSPYIYVRNNPISIIDPDGAQSFDWFGIGVAVDDFLVSIFSKEAITENLNIEDSYANLTRSVNGGEQTIVENSARVNIENLAKVNLE